MRPIGVAFLLVILSCSISAQVAPEWQRVYTFDDSIIEMNTQLVTFISKDVARARFRWTFDEPITFPGDQKLQYKSQLDVLEFNCSAQLYRQYHTTYFDEAGNIVLLKSSPGHWQPIPEGSMPDKLLTPACELVKEKLKPETKTESTDAAELDQAEKYAQNVAQRLEQTKDFKAVVDEFFITGYLDGYLQEKDANRFLNLNLDVAATLQRSELQRYYLAVMNTGYLSSLYLISQLGSNSEESQITEKMIPADVRQVISEHPYTSTYKKDDDNFHLLAETIDTAQRLRSYTDLLERIAELMRKHVKSVAPENSESYKLVMKEWDLYNAKVRVCSQSCFGLPAGTKLFEVNIPVFCLQLAKIGDELKIVAAVSRF